MNGQDLKNSILQLAIQGKLVEQREEEGTAKELLEKIEAEKKRLIKEGKIKKQKKLQEIREDEIPFEIPDNWEWVRVGDIGSWGAGATPSRSNPKFYGGDIPWLKTGDLNDGYIIEVPEFISEEALKKTSVRLNPTGSVLMAMYGATIGKLGILDIEATTNQACCACIPYSIIYNKYLFYFLMGQRRVYVKMGAGGAQPNISKDKIVNSLIPLPPLEEQKRIVAKIEELMPYVDKYDIAYSEVEELNKKFPEDMQKSILQYAIQGKLAEQREEDGTAEDLYKQIQEEKKKLIKEGKIKKSKALPEITEDEIPFDIPENWKWVRIAEIIDYDLGGGTPSKQKPSYWNGNIPWMSVKDYVNNPSGINDTLEKITEEGLKNSSSNLIPAGNIIVCTRVGLGKIAINNVNIAINQDLRALILSKYINKNYFIYYYNRINIVGKGTTVKGIKREELLNFVFPLPPLKEQKRIVDKIEELLPYCKQLVK